VLHFDREMFYDDDNLLSLVAEVNELFVVTDVLRRMKERYVHNKINVVK
jgi:hypothetical protein